MFIYDVFSPEAISNTSVLTGVSGSLLSLSIYLSSGLYLSAALSLSASVKVWTGFFGLLYHIRARQPAHTNF